MKHRKRHLTARIKPATKHALMAQLALAASEIERLRMREESLADEVCEMGGRHGEWERGYNAGLKAYRPWWRRLLGLR